MRRIKPSLISFVEDRSGAIASTLALALTGLITVGGLAIDYSRLVSLASELQNAADHAALAGVTQLNGKSGACSRAVAAARTLVSNNALIANDGKTPLITIANEPACDAVGLVRFYQDAAATTAADSDSNARFIRIRVDARTVRYALTPLTGLYSSGLIASSAMAGIGQAVCRVPPVMICNPSEPIGNMDLYYPFSIPVGTGLRLVTGNATVPGNFGWLDNGIGNGTQALASALGNDEPPGDCEDYEGVSTKTGMDAAVLKAFNTRFDIFANGGTTCPQGVCSPSTNARKDVVCASSTGVSCTNDNWSFSTKPYRPTAASALPLDGSADPDIMGYPRDYCHAVPAASQCGVTGTGNWDRDAYFRVNYGWANQAAWTFGTGLPATATRYQVYNWELAHPTVTVNGVARGIGVPQLLSGNKAAFGRPATGRAGIDPSSGIDKRRLTVAMLNCIALNLKGETSNIPVSKWMDVFTVEPALQRGSGANAYTDQKDIYVEVIAETGSGQYGASTGQIVMRAVPLLIR